MADPDWSRVAEAEATWVRQDSQGRLWGVAQTGPRLGHPDEKWTATGPDYQATEHPTRPEAMAAIDKLLD